jgi:hypothetical protein
MSFSSSSSSSVSSPSHVSSAPLTSSAPSSSFRPPAGKRPVMSLAPPSRQPKAPSPVSSSSESDSSSQEDELIQNHPITAVKTIQTASPLVLSSSSSSSSSDESKSVTALSRASLSDSDSNDDSSSESSESTELSSNSSQSNEKSKSSRNSSIKSKSSLTRLTNNRPDNSLSYSFTDPSNDYLFDRIDQGNHEQNNEKNKKKRNKNQRVDITEENIIENEMGRGGKKSQSKKRKRLESDENEGKQSKVHKSINHEQGENQKGKNKINSKKKKNEGRKRRKSELMDTPENSSPANLTGDQTPSSGGIGRSRQISLDPQASSGWRKSESASATFKGIFDTAIPELLYGFGDSRVSLSSTVALLEGILVEIMKRITQKALNIEPGKAEKLKIENVLFQLKGNDELERIAWNLFGEAQRFSEKIKKAQEKTAAGKVKSKATTVYKGQ